MYNYPTSDFQAYGMRLLISVFCLVLICCWAPAALGQKETGTSAPIAIEADRMETSQEENAVFFSGNVRASQGRLFINADEMTVRYSPGKAGADVSATAAASPGQKIEKILARGNVRIVQGEWTASGDTMDFKADEHIVIITGNAKAWQEQNMVSGEKIILYLDEGKSVVEGGPRAGERVKAFIYPSSPDDTNGPNSGEN